VTVRQFRIAVAAVSIWAIAVMGSITAILAIYAPHH